MAYAIRLGGSLIPVETGPTTDTLALAIENPVGTTVFGVAPAGNITGSPNISSSKLNLGAATAETAAATTTVDVTKTLHRIAVDGANFSGAINCAASAAGSDGDVLVLEFVNTPSNGTTTITFTTNFKPSATLAVTQAHVGTVMFVSNGTVWYEINRSAIIVV